MKQLLVEALLPVAMSLASIVIPALIAVLAQRFHRWTGMEIEARHREALQSALANAAKMIAAGASKKSGVDYILTSVPDALKAFGIDGDGRIEDLLEPHIAAGSKPQ